MRLGMGFPADTALPPPSLGHQSSGEKFLISQLLVAVGVELVSVSGEALYLPVSLTLLSVMSM